MCGNVRAVPKLRTPVLGRKQRAAGRGARREGSSEERVKSRERTVTGDSTCCTLPSSVSTSIAMRQRAFTSDSCARITASLRTFSLGDAASARGSGRGSLPLSLRLASTALSNCPPLCCSLPCLPPGEPRPLRRATSMAIHSRSPPPSPVLLLLSLLLLLLPLLLLM